VERHGDRHDSLRPSSGNLDYLLDDEDEPKRGWGKLVLFVIALMLAVGFGYVRFKQGGFDFLMPGEKKPAATADTSQHGGDSGSAPAAATTPDSNAAPAGTGGAATSTDGAAAAKPADSSPAPATTPASEAQSSAQGAGQTTAPAAGSAAVAPPAASSQGPSSQAAPAQTSAADSNAGAETAAVSSTESEKPSAAPARARIRPAKPAAAVKPPAGRYFDSVAEAERYIYGRGVAQDCDHGLRLLKPAAQQADAKAMITLGALYSTGTCTPRDLPTAYRWFALALHKQPDNQTLQNDLQSLWSQMTPPERQLAIKLSQ